MKVQGSEVPGLGFWLLVTGSWLILSGSASGKQPA
jgi:hypothetical protein